MMSSVKAGFSKVDITPPERMQTCGLGYWYARCVPFTGVRDPLFARVLVLGDDAACQVIISVDAILDTYGFIPDAQARIARELRIPEANVFITCTHTHSAPLVGINHTNRGFEYGAWVADRAVTATLDAFAKREMMSITLARGSVDGALYNRRPLLRNGRIAELHVALDPDEVIDAGPVNTTMTLLRFRAESGVLAGGICHFGIHGVAVQCSPLISSDCMGRAIQIAEAEADGPPVLLHLNGPCGDIDPIAMGSDAALASMTERLFAAIRQISAGAETPVCMAPQQVISGSFRVRRRETRTEDDLIAAERELATNEEDANHRHHSGAGYERYLIAEERAVAAMPQTFDIPYQIFRAGEVMWVGVGGEIFTCSGMHLQAVAPDFKILPVGITGASKGYLPPEQAFSQGGYEVAAARWCAIAPSETEKLFAHVEAEIERAAGAACR